ncbi:MAG: hypothetical protein J5614_08585 [Paludibacteraceae bacterium]|nr:hypothetical protein [Paludibacteraceae bacterium]
MNELWYAKFKSVMTQMNNVGDKIQETVAKCDEATKILVGRKMFEYYDESTNICDGIPIHPEPITINLKESTSFGEYMINDASTTFDGEKLWDMELGLWYNFDVMDSPKLGDEIIQFWVNINIGMKKSETFKEIIFDCETASDYIENFAQSRYPGTDTCKLVGKYTADDFKALISELFDDERNVKMFHDWIDKIVEIVNAFELSNDRGDTNE